MSFIEEQRKQILEENNTAQTDFLDFLENLSPTVSTIDVSIPLSGDIDCEVLTKCSFKGITALTFCPGDITSLKNIPQGITKLVCAENFLTDIPVLPESIVELDLHKNAVRLANSTWSRDLKELNLSDNQISSLENLPVGLEVLKVENCRLKILKLDGLEKLRVLHCSGNIGLVIENLPDTLTDFQCENDVITEINKMRSEINSSEKESEKHANFNECLQEFFRLKSLYEAKVLALKRNIFKEAKSKKEFKRKVSLLRPKCVNCDRSVGSIFENKGRTYIARCGDTSHPCGFRIELFGGEFESVKDSVERYYKLLEITKLFIIKDKLDVVFDYMTEEDGVEMFKENLDEYTKENHHFQTLKKEYDDLYFNEEDEEKLSVKKKKIAQIKERIQELFHIYKMDENPEALNDVMTAYVTELIPEINNEAFIRYKIREINFDENRQLFELFQQNWRLNQLEYTFGEFPRVIHFTSMKN